MEDPVAEIPAVIQLLCQSPPTIQQTTLARFFTPSASFTHPFCRTGSYDYSGRIAPDSALGKLFREGGPLPILSSRALTGAVYRWYKVLSPEIAMGIDSVAFDSIHQVLYVSMHQTFKLVVLPGHRANVHLVTVLNLERDLNGAHNRPVYRIAAQNDRYQVDEWIKFVSIFRILWAFWMMAAFAATLACVAGQAVFWPLVKAEEWWGAKKAHATAEKIEAKEKEKDGKKHS